MKHKLLTLFVALFATTALWAGNTITYTASSQLFGYIGFLDVGATTFGPAITSHTFSNGTGTITCSGEITTIGRYAFYKCSSLTSVTIPNSVTTIGDSAFYECSDLTLVTIPNSVTTIGDGAFQYCSGLTSVTIPNSVTTIGRYAFYKCSSLTTPIYNATIFARLPEKYQGAYTIPDGIQQIAGNAFEGCRKLSSVTIPNSVTTIGFAAFWGLNKLTSVTISSSVRTIDGEAFDGCHLQDVYITDLEAWCNVTIEVGRLGRVASPLSANNLYVNNQLVTDLVIPDGVTEIKDYVFSNCNSLTSVMIPNSVTTIGDSAFYNCSGLTSVAISNSVTTIGDYAFSGCTSLTSPVYNANCFAYMPTSYIGAYTIPDGIQQIAGGAFSSCSGLTSVTIPNSVTTIGNHAFSGCSGLTSIAIPNSVTTIGEWAFYHCDGLTSVTIPNSVTTIGSSAFSWCSGLTSVTIPNSVTTIGGYAFAYCSRLTSVTIPNSVTTIGEYAFYIVNNIVYNGTATGSPWGAKCVNGYVDGYLVYSDNTKTKLCGCSSVATGEITIPNSVTTIGSSAFYNCSGLTSVTIPNSVTTIGGDAFAYCSGLTSVTIPNSVTTIGDGAFQYCSGLTSVTIPSSVTTIGSSAFSWCSGLTSVTIPNSVTTIGEWAFYHCDGLTSVTIPNSVTTIGSSAFSWCSGLTSITIPNSVTTIGNGAFRGCSGLTSVTIPNSVTTIGNFAFSDCSSLTSVTIGNSVTTIGNFAFYICSGLTSVTIPNSVTTIGVSAFSWCSGLTSVTIPNSVTTIGGDAFQYCSGLTSITCYATTPPACGNDCFYNVDKTIPVYVPAQSVDAYKQAEGWKDFTNIQANPEDFAVVTCIAVNGTIEGAGKYIKGDACTLTANPNYGYHFAQWSDGNTDNPRSFVVTKDSIFTAQFDKNTYTISTAVNDNQRGTVQGGSSTLYLDKITLTAIPNYGYHFTQWTDGNTDNPRKVVVNEDKTYTAQFDKNQYVVTVNKGEHIQSIIGAGTYDYLDEITLSVKAETYYRFDHWSDGNTDNPREVIITQDTSFIAISAKITSGNCGDNLTWNYNDGILSISGTGAMYDYTQGTAPWILFQDSISSLVINNGCTSIGNFAFYGLSNKNLKTIDIPNSVEQIGQYAFANCEYVKNLYLGLSLEKIAANAFANDERLIYITCYAIEPPLLDESAFVNYDAYLSVPCESQADYKVFKGWKLFNKENVSCIGAEEKSVTTDEVIVAPEASQATFTWPQNEQAAGYSIEITKDGVVFCTLKFNAQGQLTGIAFAPSRGGQAREMAAATMTANGWQFTVTGLNQASKYGYTLDALNASQQSIKHYEGEFATDGYVGLYTLPYEGKDGIGSAKFIHNNQLFIRHNGKLYNSLGGKVR